MAECTLHVLRELFIDSLFEIPDYQRGYDWTRKEVEDFWNDLDALQPPRHHYLGTMVLFDLRSPVIRDRVQTEYKRYQVVDGQQRLTTIFILLKCMLVEYKKLARISSDFNENVTTLERQLSISVKGTQRMCLTLNNELHPFFVRSILNDEKVEESLISEGHLLKAKEILQAKLVESTRAAEEANHVVLNKLLAKINNQVRINVFRTQVESDVGVMFETLNNRGRPLSEMEKVKNFLLYTARRHHAAPDQELQLHHLVKTINHTWATCMRALSAYKLIDTTKLRHENELIRMHGSSISTEKRDWKGQASSAVREHIAEHAKKSSFAASITSYCTTLEGGVDVYCIMQVPFHPSSYAAVRLPKHREQLRRWTWKITRLNPGAGFGPLLMQAYRRCIGPNDLDSSYLTLLAYCEIFMVRVNGVAGKKTSTGHAELFRLANDLAQVAEGTPPADCLSGIFRRLKMLIVKLSKESKDSSVDLYKTFANVPIELKDRDTSDRVLKYILYEYERDLCMQHERECQYEMDDLTIEHVLPFNGGDDPNSYWNQKFKATQREKYRAALGNLSLATRADNASYGTKPFQEKCGSASTQSCYASSDLFIAKEFTTSGPCWDDGVPPTDWTPKTIKKRGQFIARWIVRRWENPLHEMRSELPPSFDVMGYFGRDVEEESADECADGAAEDSESDSDDVPMEQAEDNEANECVASRAATFSSPAKRRKSRSKRKKRRVGENATKHRQ